MAQRQLTQDHIDGMTEAFKICSIYVDEKTKAALAKELQDTLASIQIIAPDKTREIQIDAINKIAEVKALNAELALCESLSKNLAVHLNKLGVNFLSEN